jgi:plasmid stabilization system protein ParE
MKVEVLETALDDLSDGFHFYENQSEGLGIYFVDTLWSDIDSLCAFAGIHPLCLDYHRLLSKRFPYAVYYKIENNVARVWAVLDCRRDPAWIRKQLR